MKIRFSYFFFIALLLLFLSNSNNPPNGRTGAPGDNGECSNCHNGGAPLIDGNVTITGIPSEVIANETYDLTLTINNTTNNALKGGFQMVVLNSDNENIGILSNPSDFAALSSSSGRTYFEHSPAQNFSAGTVSYSVSWTAPDNTSATNNELITFYAAANIGNGNNSTSGDYAPNTTLNTIFTAPDDVQINLISSTNPSCPNFNDGSATVSASSGMPPYNFEWSNGETGNTASTLSAGNHQVTVTDFNGSTAATTVILSDPPTIINNLITIEDVTCFDENNGNIFIESTGGTGNLSFFWSNGSSNQNLLNVAPGNYSLTVIDENNCSITDFYAIDGPSEALTVNIFESESIPCNGLFGSLTAFSNADNPEYVWSNGINTDLNAGIPSGTYTVIVTDQFGCQASSIYTINEPDTINIIFDTEYPQNDDNGSITPIVTGGISPYEFMWSNGTIDSVLIDVGIGEYTLTVTDQNNCQFVATEVIDAVCDLNIDSFHINNLDCYNINSGSIELFISETNIPYEVEWSTGEDSTYINNLAAGMYSATVTDTTGCKDSVSLLLFAPDPININFEITNPTESNPNSGMIQANINGGAFPYHLNWSTGDTTNLITNLEEGTYYITVEDFNGCIKTDTVSIENILCSIDYSIEISDPDCYNGLGEALVVFNDPGVFLVFWSNGDTGNLADSLNVDFHTVSISDTNNCEIIDTITISNSVDSISLDSLYLQNYTCDDSLGSIYLEAMGGNGDYLYLWNTGETDNSLLNLEPDLYTVTITDKNNCSNEFSFQIEENPSDIFIEFDTIDVYLDNSGNFSGIPDIDNSLLTLSGGCNDSLSYSFDSIFLDCSDLGLIQYTGILYNFQDSINEVDAILLVKDTIPPTLLECPESGFNGTTICNPGLLSITVNLDDNLIQDNCSGFFLSNEFTFEFDIDTIIGNQPKTIPFNFEIPYSDASGNIAVCQIIEEITVNPLIIVDIEVEDVLCYGEENGCIQYNILSGLPPFNVLPETLCDIPAGNYTVNIMDQANCMNEQIIEVSQPDEITIAIDSIKNETPGESDGWILVDVSGGLPPYKYVWTENNVFLSNQEDLVNYPSSQYKLTVTDSTGCIVSFSTFIDIANDISQETFSNLIAYPNPFNNEIILKGISITSEVEMYDLLGKNIYVDINRSEDEWIINTENLISGVYTIKFSLKGKNQSIKVVKY